MKQDKYVPTQEIKNTMLWARKEAKAQGVQRAHPLEVEIVSLALKELFSSKYSFDRNYEFKLIICMGFSLGLRYSEIMKITKRDISIIGEKILIDLNVTKNRTKRRRDLPDKYGKLAHSRKY